MENRVPLVTFFRLKLSAAVVFSPLLTVISILKLLVASLYPFVCVPTLSLALNNSCKSMQAEQFFISSHDKFSILIVLVAFSLHVESDLLYLSKSLFQGRSNSCMNIDIHFSLPPSAQALRTCLETGLWPLALVLRGAKSSWHISLICSATSVSITTSVVVSGSWKSRNLHECRFHFFFFFFPCVTWMLASQTPLEWWHCGCICYCKELGSWIKAKTCLGSQFSFLFQGLCSVECMAFDGVAHWTTFMLCRKSNPS